MPRNVRNFWIDVDVDGRASRFGSGPTSKTGGLRATFLQRADKGIVKACTVEAYAGDDGRLTLNVYDGSGLRCYQFQSERDQAGHGFTVGAPVSYADRFAAFHNARQHAEAFHETGHYRIAGCEHCDAIQRCEYCEWIAR